MPQDAISLTIHRKAGRLLVTPWSLSKIGFQCLHDVFVAESGIAGLQHALETAATRARDASMLPLDSRFEQDRTPYWERAGARSEKEFVKDATAVKVLLSAKRTQFQYLVPMKDNDGMQGKGEPLSLEPGLSFERIAREVVAMFEHHG